MRSLSEMQRAFVAAYTSEPDAISNASAAARLAGRSGKNAHEIGRQLLEKPHIVTAIREAFRTQINVSLAGQAMTVLSQLLRDETAPKKIRLEAAKTILDRAGYAARQAQPDEGMRPLKELSIEELKSLLGETMRENAEAAMPVLDLAAED